MVVDIDTNGFFLWDCAVRVVRTGSVSRGVCVMALAPGAGADVLWRGCISYVIFSLALFTMAGKYT